VETDERTLEYWRSYLGSPIWQECDEPVLTERFQEKVRKVLMGRSSLSEAELRCLLAEAAELDFVLNFRQRAIAEHDLTIRQEEDALRDEKAEQADAEFLARHGHHSPYRQEVTPPEPEEQTE
jgi:hypothetical protein